MGRSGSHAWSFTKLWDTDYWFKTDLLSGEFLAPGVNGKGNLTVQGDYTTRHYKWFEFGTLEYPRNLLKYPSVWVNLSAQNAVISQGAEYDLLTFVNDFGSIYSENMKKSNITVTIDKVDEDGNLIKKNLKGFDISSSACDFGPGYYKVNYTLTDDNTATGTVSVTVKQAVSAPASPGPALLHLPHRRTAPPLHRPLMSGAPAHRRAVCGSPVPGHPADRHNRAPLHPTGAHKAGRTYSFRQRIWAAAIPTV